MLDADPDELLRSAGRELAQAMATAVPLWVVCSVKGLVEAWGHLDEDSADRTLVQAGDAAKKAGDQVLGEMTALADADCDQQSYTPLTVARRATRWPTDVLQSAGIPPIERDGFQVERFPDDHYGLVPASLAGLDPELAELGLVWGAAKALAHRARHR